MNQNRSKCERLLLTVRDVPLLIHGVSAAVMGVTNMPHAPFV
jgi:hypothetical protein